MQRSTKKIKPEVDYRQFRFKKMNTPEFSHVKLLLFWPFFGLMFMFLERFQPERHYYVVHCALDDLIPFWEWALIPYLLWFVFLIGALIYTFFFDTRAFRRMMHFVIVTYGITLLIYIVFPTCQELRPEHFDEPNILTDFITGFYSFDTNTNVCPSLHVIGSFAAMFALWDCKRFQNVAWKIVFGIIAVCISLSTYETTFCCGCHSCIACVRFGLVAGLRKERSISSDLCSGEIDMDKKFKQQLGLIAFGVALFTALNNLNYISDFLHVCAELLTPVFAGLLMAFILSVPMRGIGKRLSRLMPKASERTINVLSLIITLLLLVAIIVLLCVIAIPQLIASVKSIISLIKEKWPDWAAVLRNYGFDTAEISAYLNKLDWKTIAEKAMNGAGVVIGSVVSVAGSTISTVVNAAVSLVIMFYVLVGKQELGKQTRRALYAYCKESVADKVCHIAKLSHDTYAKFLSGQCVEVLILGTLIFLSFSIFRIPYAGLTAVLTAAFAFVPYIGAFLSCAIGMLLTLLAEPNKVILCLIVYQAAQFVENQFIYPHVVGSSVGLSPFWTLLAVLLGGKMFGVLGIIFFIPLMAVISQLLHENIEHRLAVRKLKKNDLIQKSD